MCLESWKDLFSSVATTMLTQLNLEVSAVHVIEVHVRITYVSQCSNRSVCTYWRLVSEATMQRTSHKLSVKVEWINAYPLLSEVETASPYVLQSVCPLVSTDDSSLCHLMPLTTVYHDVHTTNRSSLCHPETVFTIVHTHKHTHPHSQLNLYSAREKLYHFG